MDFHIVTRTGHPDFFGLPWHLPLSQWDPSRLVEVERGIGRNVVRFTDVEGALYALKELPFDLARREYRFLRALAARAIPVVEAVGVVERDARNAVLITRHLDLSLPYRAAFERFGSTRHERLVDGLAELLVRLHLAGFFWGDCSPSNALFRRDAGALAAYLVDAETGEIQGSLSHAQREYDLEIAHEKVAAELTDLAASGGGSYELDPVATADFVRSSYARLWAEVTQEDHFSPEERYRIDARLRRLNELGFDVGELELRRARDGARLRVRPQIVESGHHRRRLTALTGLDVQENQARRLLGDIAAFRTRREDAEGRAIAEVAAAHRWLVEAYMPVVDSIPQEIKRDIGAPEAFHEVLEHRWFLSEAAGRDVGETAAVASYVKHALGGRHALQVADSAPGVDDDCVRPARDRKRIALVAHDNKKNELLEWARFNRATLADHELYATGTSGALLERELTLDVARVNSGPLGGDLQIGSMIAQDQLDLLIFLWDPLEPQPHDPDVRALLRMAVVWNIPVACNRSTADFIISSPLMGDGYRPIVPDYAARSTPGGGTGAAA